MPEEKIFTKYEETLLKVIQNVVEKLVAAIILYDSKLSYTSAFFLTVIAEEELAKLYLLPIVNEYGGLEEMLTDKESAFYKHRIKQRIFSSYIYFDRKWDEIDEKKQSALYVGINKKGEVDFCRIKPEECYLEINNAVWVFQYQMKHIASEKTLSEKFIKACLFLNNILGGCVRDKVPEIGEDMKRDVEKATKKMMKKKERAEAVYYESLFKNPYEQIRILKHALGEEKYKEFLKKTHKLSFHEMVQELGRELTRVEK